LLFVTHAWHAACLLPCHQDGNKFMNLFHPEPQNR